MKQHSIGTRNVSTLTPTQLDRKRANDREAQRAIRARNKERVAMLERRVEDLKSAQSLDRRLRELIRRNISLEEEISHFRETMSVSVASSPCSAVGMYDNCLSPSSGGVWMPRISPFLTGFGNFNMEADGIYQPVDPFRHNCDIRPTAPISAPTSTMANAWSPAISFSNASPTSSGSPDDYHLCSATLPNSSVSSNGGMSVWECSPKRFT
ncbi:hypothetical protein S40293_10232 [Stachybotrys chartarum IBT 40293]|nr:hypothetical protein S40293_10232 [Stachybotrys chartarum IBT 40293]